MSTKPFRRPYGLPCILFFFIPNLIPHFCSNGDRFLVDLFPADLLGRPFLRTYMEVNWARMYPGCLFVVPSKIMEIDGHIYGSEKEEGRRRRRCQKGRKEVGARWAWWAEEAEAERGGGGKPFAAKIHTLISSCIVGARIGCTFSYKRPRFKADPERFFGTWPGSTEKLFYYW